MLIRVVEPDGDMIYSSEDFFAGELITHSQSCIWLTGDSDLARALLSNVDAHSALAATVLGVNYDDFLKHKDEPKFKSARQGAKPFNFGKPGGMGDAKLVLQQRKQGDDTPCALGPIMIEDGKTLVPGYRGLRFCILMDGADRCGMHPDGTPNKANSWGSGRHVKPIPPTCRHCLECAARLGAIWKRQWRENEPYFKFVSQCVERGMVIPRQALDRWPHLRDVYTDWQQLDPGQIMQHYSGRLRNVNSYNEEDEGSPFCAAANSFFQALLADIAKESHRTAARECHDHTIRVPEMLYPNSLRSAYAGMQSPLYGSRIPGFFHDELLGEHPRSVAHDAAMRISEIMRDVMRHYCPDLASAARAEPTLMKRWYKQAVPWWRDGGKKAAGSTDRLVPWEPEFAKAA